MKIGLVVLCLWLAGVAFAQSVAARGDTAAPGDTATPGVRAHIRFTDENPQLNPPAYSLDIYEDGMGSFVASVADDPGPDIGLGSAARTIHIHDPLRSNLFRTARGAHFFGKNCESSQKHVAFTGKKTFTYQGSDGAGSCTFNYSRQDSLNQIAGELMSVAYTINTGARLASEHVHDRLALDAELQALQSAAQDHRALELENIAPELQSIADDDAVMERARKRARELLSEAGATH